MMTALASVIDSNDPEEIDQIIREGIPDPVGSFYRFSLAGSLLRRTKKCGRNGNGTATSRQTSCGPTGAGQSDNSRRTRSMKRISIDPVTRLEGHGKIDIFLDDEGDVANAYLQIPELRGFEQFCVGRPAEDMPNLTARICGVCPEAHHMAATKALDALFHVDPPPAAKKLRELFYSIFYATDHTTHFYALGGPDFVVGPTAPAAERNILGVVKKVGMDIAGKVLKMRRDGHALIKMIGGRAVHPNWGLPGGVSRGINEEQRKEIEARGREAVEFAKFSLKLFDDVVLDNSDYVKLITGDVYVHRTYNMGTVDADNRVNFYDGMIRVVGPDGREHAKYDAARLPRVRRRAGRALDLPQVPLPEEGRLEGAGRRRRFRRVQGHAAVAAERRRRHGHAAGPGRIREVLRRPWAASRSTTPWPPIGRG